MSFSQSELVSVDQSDLKRVQMNPAPEWWCGGEVRPNVWSQVNVLSYPPAVLKSGDFVILGRGMWMILFFVQPPKPAVKEGARPLAAPLKALLLAAAAKVGWYDGLGDQGIRSRMRLFDATSTFQVSSRGRDHATSCGLSASEIAQFREDEFDQGVEERTIVGARAAASLLLSGRQVSVAEVQLMESMDVDLRLSDRDETGGVSTVLKGAPGPQQSVTQHPACGVMEACHDSSLCLDRDGEYGSDASDGVSLLGLSSSVR
jgi:hypothetical protein